MSATKGEIIDLLPCTAQQLADAIGVTLKQAHGRLGHLKDLGMVVPTDLMARNDNARGPKFSRLWKVAGAVAPKPAERMRHALAKDCAVAFLMTEKPADYDDYEALYVPRLDKFFYVRALVVNGEKPALGRGERLLAMVEGARR